MRFVEGDQVAKRDLLAACEMLVMPSRAILRRGDTEGFGMVFLEAGACGKPVVGGDSGGIRDAVVDGETGLLVDPEDPAEVGAAICRLLSDRELAARLGERGRQRVLERFDFRRGCPEMGPVMALGRAVDV